MARSNDKCFVLEVPIAMSALQERRAIGCLDVARRLYNTIIQEGLQSLAAMRVSEAWQQARQLPKGTAARQKAFRECHLAFGFNEYALQAIATRHKNAATWQSRLGAHETQTIATRAYRSLIRYAVGQGGQPRFKSFRRPLHSVEGKSKNSGVRWSDSGHAIWGKQAFAAKLPTAAQDPYFHAAQQHATKYARILWRHVKGHKRWYVQLVKEGSPPQKYDFDQIGRTAGLDVGPSTVAVVGDDVVGLVQFAPSVTEPWALLRTLQRAQDRSRRATNPDNYAPNGQVKKGRLRWQYSERYQQRRAQIADIQRRLAAGRRRDHGHLTNQILVEATRIHTEALSYLAFQKCFGRSVKVRAPGAFIQQLTRKAESAGGEVVHLNTQRLKMSQYDHVSGTYTKKPLSQRWHPLDQSATWVQRDCYSAFLAKHAGSGCGHNPTQLEIGWAAAEPLLRQAGLCKDQVAKSGPHGQPTVAIPSERLACKRRLKQGLDVNARLTPVVTEPLSVCL